MFELPTEPDIAILADGALFDLALSYMHDDVYSEAAERTLSAEICRRLNLELQAEVDLYRASDAPLRLLAKSLELEIPGPTCSQTEEERRASIAKRHADFLKSRGQHPARLVDGSRIGHRTTHCYRCKSNLDNSINLECSACRWIVCYCGACGCGWQT